MNDDVTRLFGTLAGALAEYDSERVDEVTAQLIGLAHDSDAGLDEASAIRLLKMLKRRRRWDLVSDAAETFLQTGLRVPDVWLIYAQALLDEGKPHAALEILKRLDSKAGNDARTFAEVRGLIGRTYKDLYLALADTDNPRRRRYLERSLEAYFSVFERDPTAGWHGINLVALSMRAKQDNLSAKSPIKPKKLARRLLEDVEEASLQGTASLWDAAIALEASVALRLPEKAQKWAHSYANDPKADYFEIGSTLRQLRDVWQLGAEPWEAGILQILEANALRHGDGARIDVGPKQLEQMSDVVGLEKVFGADGIVTYKWYAQGLARGRSVARVEDKSGKPIGTAFVVRAADLGLDGAEPVLMTNAHVLAPEPGRGVTPDRAVVAFEALDDETPRREFPVSEILFSSPVTDFDTTVFRISGDIADVVPMPMTDARPELADTTRIYVIGHPLGGTLSFSIDDNKLIAYNERKIHYRTPTQEGSSGSPVFNADWELIGIHHAGGNEMPRLDGEGRYQANEGIWITAVRAALTS